MMTPFNPLGNFQPGGPLGYAPFNDLFGQQLQQRGPGGGRCRCGAEKRQDALREAIRQAEGGK